MLAILRAKSLPHLGASLTSALFPLSFSRVHSLSPLMAVPCPRSLFSSTSTDKFSDRKRISLSNLSLGAEIGGARDRRNLIVPSTEAWDPAGERAVRGMVSRGVALYGGHRGSTFVVVISGEIVASPYLESLLQGGVQRVHILDGTPCGALLLELLTGDGVGTMVASDVYEGTLMGRLEDIPGIKHVIRPLEESGALIQRSNEQLLKALDSFIVVERDGLIIACAALFPFFEEKCGELAAVT